MLKIERLTGVEGAKIFREALKDAIASSSNGHHLLLRDVQEYVGHPLFVIFDKEGKKPVAGGAVIDGFITSVFKNFQTAPKSNIYSVMHPIMKVLMENGGTKVGCFGDYLTGVYMRFGFLPVSRAGFDGIFSPQTWPLNEPKDDVVFMLRVEKDVNKLIEQAGDAMHPLRCNLQMLPLVPKFKSHEGAYEFMDLIMAHIQNGNISHNYLESVIKSGRLLSNGANFERKFQMVGVKNATK